MAKKSAQKKNEEESEKNHGLVMINTGNGKGKTTAAMGLMLRAWGHDKKVIMLQFVKNTKANFGEHRAAKQIGIEIIAGGAGFVVPGVTGDVEKSARLSRELWSRAANIITSGEYDMVVLDELSYPLKYEWLDVQEVISALRNRPDKEHVVITGRDMPDELIEFADMVTEFNPIKHHFYDGIEAQPGIEF
ncbi:MAG: cob(I)yrinic acid a,c-diamide adenosyltransferase [Dehalococcoidales bacterium]|nr:MAG: cob(I)yrinic acid a,c-diamide adenosyltransferase [Dehalococcoidales bacterium]